MFAEKIYCPLAVRPVKSIARGRLSSRAAFLIVTRERQAATLSSLSFLSIYTRYRILYISSRRPPHGYRKRPENPRVLLRADRVCLLGLFFFCCQSVCFSESREIHSVLGGIEWSLRITIVLVEWGVILAELVDVRGKICKVTLTKLSLYTGVSETNWDICYYSGYLLEAFMGELKK